MAETNFSSVLEGDFFRYVYNLLKANVLRERKALSMILLCDPTKGGSSVIPVQEKMLQTVRERDVLFTTEASNEIGILLPQSGREEAVGLLRRLENENLLFSNESSIRTLHAAILEIYNPEISIDVALENCRLAVKEVPITHGLKIVEAHSDFERPVITVKISIVESDRIFRELLVMTVERIQVAGVELHIQGFEDGLAFSRSNWTTSWHPHIVVMNDVLPKKNGLDILHELRSMPNEEKFTVLMMTRRNAEEDMIYAYESGTDGYLVKPFNLRLFEAQLQRMLAGLWS